MKIIRARMKGKPVDLEAPAEPQQAEVVDLMERLRRSLQGAGGSARKKKTAGRARKATRGASRKKRAA